MKIKILDDLKKPVRLNIKSYRCRCAGGNAVNLNGQLGNKRCEFIAANTTPMLKLFIGGT